jgi:hypothetical protein
MVLSRVLQGTLVMLSPFLFPWFSFSLIPNFLICPLSIGNASFFGGKEMGASGQEGMKDGRSPGLKVASASSVRSAFTPVPVLCYMAWWSLFHGDLINE